MTSELGLMGYHLSPRIVHIQSQIPRSVLGMIEGRDVYEDVFKSDGTKDPKALALIMMRPEKLRKEMRTVQRSAHKEAGRF